MSLLSTFIADHVVNALERELLTYEPNLQEVFLNEVKAFTDVLGKWLSQKLQPKAE